MKFCMNVPGSMWKISTEPEISTEIEYSKIYKCFFIYLISQHSVQSSKNALCSWKKINTYKLHWLRIVSYNPQEKLDKGDYFYILKIYLICIPDALTPKRELQNHNLEGSALEWPPEVADHTDAVLHLNLDLNLTNGQMQIEESTILVFVSCSYDESSRSYGDKAIPHELDLDLTFYLDHTYDSM